MRSAGGARQGAGEEEMRAAVGPRRAASPYKDLRNAIKVALSAALSRWKACVTDAA